MQISSGWAKGLRLVTPAGAQTRPTAAKVRAALLNSLQPDLEQALVLDVFAGSGALGIEAVSRGARSATFIEAAPAAIKALNTNLAELSRRATMQGLTPPSIQVLQKDAKKALPGLMMATTHPDAGFDIIFMDPPYNNVKEALQSLVQSLASCCRSAALLALESHIDAQTLVQEMLNNQTLSPWQILKQKQYGDTMITIFQK